MRNSTCNEVRDARLPNTHDGIADNFTHKRKRRGKIVMGRVFPGRKSIGRGVAASGSLEGADAPTCNPAPQRSIFPLAETDHSVPAFFWRAPLLKPQAETDHSGGKRLSLKQYFPPVRNGSGERLSLEQYFPQARDRSFYLQPGERLSLE